MMVMVMVMVMTLLTAIIFRHGKSYASLTEENLRREVWREEIEMVEKHNKEAEVVVMIMMVIDMLVVMIMEMVEKHITRRQR